MTTLNERAQSIRVAAASTLDGQERDDVLMRSAGLVRKIDEASGAIRETSAALKGLAETGALSTMRDEVPSDSHLRKLIDEAEARADELPRFVRSGLPGDLELAVRDYADALNRVVTGAWKTYAAEKVAETRASALLDKALGSIPRFLPTIEGARLARLRLDVLKAKEIPSPEEIREFQQHLTTLEEANETLEREVPDEYRDALRRCASPSGLRPSEVPDGFFEWVGEIGADGYFKVALSQS